MIFALLTALCAWAGPAAPSDEALADAPDAERPYPLSDRLEFSFGRSMLIVRQALYGQTEDTIEPVNSALILAEFVWKPRVSFAAFGNVPTEPIRRYDGDEFMEEPSQASAAIGVAWAPAVLPISETAYFKPQIAGFGGRTLSTTQPNQIFPTVATKLNLSTDAGFTMYGGVAFAFAEETLAIIYGIGHRF